MRVAVTGGPAEGKSTVVAYMAALGLATISADDLARTVFNEPDIQDWIRSELGAGDPSAVRHALLHNPNFRRDLNEKTHPRILALLDAWWPAIFGV